MKRSAWIGLVALVLAVPALAQPAPSTAIKQQAWDVKGLEAAAEIVVDHWGIPHIFAGSARDAYFLQGYNAARDRLWQIDLWRKRGLGLLTKSFGPGYLEQDRASRLFLYRGDMEKEWTSYAPDARMTVEAFAAGVNAYVAEVRAGTKPLPVEFKLTSTTPDDWKAEDILRVRSHALVSNVTSEVTRARVACAGGIEADQLRRKLEPVGHKLVVPKGLNPCDVPADVLKDYTLATRQVEFEKPQKPNQAASIVAETQLAELMDRQLNEGSNNWVVHPSRTATGRPILANDPHRQLGVPSLRYVVGLNAPGLNIIGAGEPALPGVSIGHNAEAAWGITIFAMDQEDLYVYETNPKNPDQYRYKGKWEPMTVSKETIEVKGEAPREVTLKFTRHGPVLKADASKNKAFAMRTVWMEPGLSGYFGASRLTHAASWDDFKAASFNWGAPPLNLVYADVKGNVGWAASGRTPARKNWDGLMPVPGDGSYEWQGFFTKDMLPSVLNPKEGFFATANEFNLPKDYPAEERKVAFEWTDPSRVNRIKEVLAANPKFSLADSMALQTDSTSELSRRARALLANLGSTRDPDLAKVIAMLKAWNGNETTASVEATIYEVWANRHLGRATVAKATPEAARTLVGNGSIEAVIDYLANPDKKLGTDPIAARDAIVTESLVSALAELRERFGPDMTTWTWGRLHRATWEPAIAPMAGAELASQMTVGPLQLPGSASTPRAQTYGRDFNVTAGASVRMVMDVGAWDNSVVINTPGQSADPMSAHYRDLFPLWAEGSYVPLAFSREAVDRAAETVIRLKPKK
ncbi:MAG TPA: penicillin acylase family protein [Hyphomonadaceae bacterium]|jgi:penicillin amidase|nr:penicillin acylase family protein [Hyphomonadaceae bacterium]